MNSKSYDKYKDSNIEWIGKIPAHWDFIPIDKFSTLITDYVANGSFASLKSNVEYLDEESYAILVRLVDNTNNFKGPFVYINKDSYNFLSKTKLKEGDIILANIGATLGTIFKVPDLGKPMSLGPNVLLVRFENDVSADFFLNLINSSIGKCFIDSITTQTTQPKFNKSELRKLRILYPPQDEQQLIVNYINKQTAKIDATIAKNEELIQLLEEKRVALINQVVTKGLNPDVAMKDSGAEWIGEIPENWEVAFLKRFTNSVSSGKTKNVEESGKYPLHGSTGIIGTTNSLDYNGTFILIARVGAYAGKTHIAKGKIGITDNTLIVDYNPQINYKFLFYLLTIYDFKALTIGSGQPLITGNDVKNIKIVIPPLNEQNDIVYYLDSEISKIDLTLSKINKNINLLEEYKTSLIHHVVTGKIDVRGEEI